MYLLRLLCSLLMLFGKAWTLLTLTDMYRDYSLTRIYLALYDQRNLI